jgi:predicted dehydrogenase
MKTAIIGFGGMGCRHAFSLVKGNQFDEIYVVEPNKLLFLDNCKRIEIDNSTFIYLNSIEELPLNIDLVVIATSAEPRFQIFEKISGKGIKYILLEKVVFQKSSDFVKAIKICKSKGISTYCNFVNRYYPNYIEIKERIGKAKNIQMIVSGGEYGLACNSLHYIDLFQYLTGEFPHLDSALIQINNSKHKRGDNYKEVIGTLKFSNKNGDSLVLISDLKKCNEVEISISFDKEIHILNESTLVHLTYKNQLPIEKKEFHILYTSFLTNILSIDILNSNCKLPSIEETFNSHVELFKGLNPCFGLSNLDNCPIT